MKPAPLISVVIPAREEGEAIIPCLRGLSRALKGMAHEILVVCDFGGDSTLAALAAMEDRPKEARGVVNGLGPGPGRAMRAGFAQARGDVVASFMADGSDDPEAVPRLAEAVRQGAAVAGAARPLSAGRSAKSLLRRAAGLSLALAGLPTADPTNNFRAYSAAFLRAVRPRSAGFSLALELTVKAWEQGLSLAEVPCAGGSRVSGRSRFSLARQLPGYLPWYARAWLAAARRRARASLSS
ncbi:MAG: glycosyltransferase family 2 protein [Deltaproteobacteria bacterium]|nr:glycosyltransferase family 2 protein [Deltaproteobacteria bacterium]